MITHVFFLVKLWIQGHWKNFQATEYLKITLIESLAVVTPKKSKCHHYDFRLEKLSQE